MVKIYAKAAAIVVVGALWLLGCPIAFEHFFGPSANGGWIAMGVLFAIITGFAFIILVSWFIDEEEEKKEKAAERSFY